MMNKTDLYNLEFNECGSIYRALLIQPPLKGQKISLYKIKELLILLMQALDELDNMSFDHSYEGTRSQNYQALKTVFLQWKKLYQDNAIFSHKTDKITI
jgi:hypothetical protein